MRACPVCACHIVPDSVCRACTVAKTCLIPAKAPFPDKWAESNPLAYAHAVKQLGRLYLYITDPAPHRSLDTILGHAVVATYLDYWTRLMAFAKVEWDAYQFSPIDFSLARFEHAFASSPTIKDFWVTILCAYDLGNYLSDLKAAAPVTACRKRLRPETKEDKNAPPPKKKKVL